MRIVQALAAGRIGCGSPSRIVPWSRLYATLPPPAPGAALPLRSDYPVSERHSTALGYSRREFLASWYAAAKLVSTTDVGRDEPFTTCTSAAVARIRREYPG